MTGIVEKLGNNFIIATFIPSLGFFVIASFLLMPVLPERVTTELISAKDAPLFGISLLLFIFSLLLGYTLMGLNSFIYKLTEGYFVLQKFSFWKKRQYRKSLGRRQQIRNIEELLNQLRKRDDAATNPQTRDLILSLRGKHTQLQAAYRLDYPLQTDNVLPTRFGNILRGAESYPNEQYGIDGVVMWPRLLYVIAPEYIVRIEQSNNGLAFIVNSMVLSFALASLCLLTSISQFYTWQSAQSSFAFQEDNYFVKNGKAPDPIAIKEFEPVRPLHFIAIDVTPDAQREYYEFGWLYLGGCFLFLITSFIFYNASLPAARQYGGLIRSAYDLFRFDLAEQLKLPQSKDWNEEKENWSIWTEFVLIGRQKDLRPFPYRYEDSDSSPS